MRLARDDSRQIAFGEGRFPTNRVWRGIIPSKMRLARGDSRQNAFREGRFPKKCVSRGTIPEKMRLARKIPRFSHLARLARLTFVGKSLVRLTFAGIFPREIDFCGNAGRGALVRLTFAGTFPRQIDFLRNAGRKVLTERVFLRTGLTPSPTCSGLATKHPRLRAWAREARSFGGFRVSRGKKPPNLRT